MLNKIKGSYWLRSGSLSLMTRLTIQAFGVLNFYFLVRIVTKDEFGEWVLLMTVAAISESVRNAFIYNPLIRYFNSNEESEYKSILSASLFLNFISFGVVMLILVVLSSLVGLYDEGLESLPMMFLIYGIGALSFTFFSHFNFVEQAHLKFLGTLISFFAQKFLFFSYIFIKYLTDSGIDLIELTLAYVSCYVISAIVSYTTARSYNEFSFKIDFKWVRELADYGKFTLGTNSSNMINKNIREWFLTFTDKPSAAAVFNAAARVTQFLEIPLMASASVFYPAVVKRVKEEGIKGAKYLYEKSVALILISVIPFVILIFVFADQIILFMAGEDYIESIPLLRIGAFTGLLMPFHRQFGITLNAIGKAKINFQFIVTSSVFGILINYFAILYYGLEGAAYGTLFTMFLGVIVLQYILKKHVGITYLNIFKYGIAAIPEGMAFVKNILSRGDKS